LIYNENQFKQLFFLFTEHATWQHQCDRRLPHGTIWQTFC